MNMKIVYPESKILVETINIVLKNNLTFYDALYIATAETNEAILKIKKYYPATRFMVL